MPTKEERREIAARLRETAGQIEFTGEGVEDCIFDNWWSYSAADGAKSYMRLADLIEPEERTCQRGTEMFSHAYPNEIVCDSDCVSTYVFPLTCGHEVELLENEWPNYCPACGAKVVEEDA